MYNLLNNKIKFNFNKKLKEINGSEINKSRDKNLIIYNYDINKHLTAVEAIKLFNNKLHKYMDPGRYTQKSFTLINRKHGSNYIGYIPGIKKDFKSDTYLDDITISGDGIYLYDRYPLNHLSIPVYKVYDSEDLVITYEQSYGSRSNDIIGFNIRKFDNKIFGFSFAFKPSSSTSFGLDPMIFIKQGDNIILYNKNTTENKLICYQGNYNIDDVLFKYNLPDSGMGLSTYNTRLIYNSSDKNVLIYTIDDGIKYMVFNTNGLVLKSEISNIITEGENDTSGYHVTEIRNNKFYAFHRGNVALLRFENNLLSVLKSDTNLTHVNKNIYDVMVCITTDKSICIFDINGDTNETVVINTNINNTDRSAVRNFDAIILNDKIFIDFNTDIEHYKILIDKKSKNILHILKSKGFNLYTIKDDFAIVPENTSRYLNNSIYVNKGSIIYSIDNDREYYHLLPF